MKRFVIEQSDEEFYTSHSGLALVGLALNRFTSLTSSLAAMNAPADLIAGIDIIRSYCALLAQGKSDFVAIEQYRNDDFFREALGNRAVPSEGTMRQRMDEYAEQILGSVVNRRPCKCAPFCHRLCVKPVVVVGQANLGYVQRTFRAPFADIDPHVNCSHESFDSAGRLPGQTVFQGGEHVAMGILQI